MFEADDAIGRMLDILQSCELVASELLRDKLVVPDAIEAQRPGGSENPTFDAAAWLSFYRWLHRTQAQGARGSVSAPARSGDLEATFAAALTDKPVAVTLADGTTRHVYPKSYDTLRFLDSLDVELRLVRERWDVAKRREVLEDAAVEALAPRMESFAVRLWVWIITSKGAEIPFDEDRQSPSLPRWTRQLAPQDLLALLHAHLEVNVRRLQLMSAAFPPDPADARGSSRLTLAGFLGSIASENEPGAARRLLVNTSLGQVFATKIAAARAAKEAMDRAKKDA